MIIQIDFSNKTIRILSNEKLKDLVNKLDELFPDKSWKDYTLLTLEDFDDFSISYTTSSTLN